MVNHLPIDDLGVFFTKLCSMKVVLLFNHAKNIYRLELVKFFRFDFIFNFQSDWRRVFLGWKMGC